MKKFEAGFIGAGNMGGALGHGRGQTGHGGAGRRCLQQPRAQRGRRPSGWLPCGRAGGDPRRQQIRVSRRQAADDRRRCAVAGSAIAASESIFVSMLAGVQLERLERLLGADKKIIRILPNTACAVGQGVVLYCANGNVTEGDLAAFCALMAAAGIVDPISEALD